MDEGKIALAKEALKDAHLVLFLGGAGVSTGSGIPDFRSPQGLYNIQSKYGVPYEEMLSATYFYRHTGTFYEFYWESMVKKDAMPNKAHFALAKYEARHKNLVIATQNIDGLHQKAGSKNVLEVHGSVWRYRCLSCGKKYSLDELEAKGVPHCSCGGLIKPLVTLYEEALEEDVLEKSVHAARLADVLIVGGTSLNVYPIAALPQYFGGRTSIIINKEPTRFDANFDFVFHEDIGEALEALLSD